VDDKKTLRVKSSEDLEIFRCLSHAVVDICKSKYWTRIWIVQEVMVAQKLFLCFGNQRVHWREFRRFSDALAGLQTVAGTLRDEPRVVRLLENCHREVKRGGIQEYVLPGIPHGDESGIVSISLHRLISSHATKEASDPRDKSTRFSG
jgi:hypothetical protein